MLTGPTFIPDNPHYAVVLLHGYGSNGYDLISLADEWIHLLPNTAFFAPNAPTQTWYDGYEWFSLNDFQPGQSITPDYLNTLSDRANKVVPDLIIYLNELSHKYNIALNKFILAGFSQGGLMAFNTAFNLTDSIAGVIGMSAVPMIQPIPTNNQIPVLLTHGKADDVVPFEAMAQTEHVLHEMNQFVTTCVSPSLGHGIDEKCLNCISQFMQNIVASNQ